MNLWCRLFAKNRQQNTEKAPVKCYREITILFLGEQARWWMLILHSQAGIKRVNYGSTLPYDLILVTIGWIHGLLPEYTTLLWRHNDHDGVSNHQPRGCLLNRLFRRRWKKTSKLRVTGLCAGNSPGTGEFPAQRASNAKNVSIWWRHHELLWPLLLRKLTRD